MAEDLPKQSRAQSEARWQAALAVLFAAPWASAEIAARLGTPSALPDSPGQD